MIFSSEIKLKSYIEVLKNEPLNAIIEEYKGFVKLTDVVDFFIKRIAFTFAKISKEIKNYYIKDKNFKELEKYSYNICHRAYLRLNNLDLILKNQSFEKLIELYKDSVISKVPDLSNKASMLKDIKRLYNVYFERNGKFSELKDKIFRAKAVCLACLEKFGVKIPNTEGLFMHAFVADYFYETEALKKANALAEDFYLLELFSICSSLN